MLRKISKSQYRQTMQALPDNAMFRSHRSRDQLLKSGDLGTIQRFSQVNGSLIIEMHTANNGSYGAVFMDHAGEITADNH